MSPAARGLNSVGEPHTLISVNDMYKHFFTLLNLLLIGTIVYCGVNAFFMVTSARLAEVPQTVETQTAPAQPERVNQRPLAYYNPLVDRNLFDTNTTVEAAPKSVDVGELEQTSLNLKLWGTVTGPPDEAYAVIEEAGKRVQNLFRIGDTVQEATVKMILREKIILNVEGKDEVLEIEKAAGAGSAAGRTIAGRPVAGQSLNEPPARTQKIMLRRSQIDSAVQDVAQLMNQVNIRPHFTQGQPDGMMFSRIQPNSLFMRMGLRNGDIITGVNGRSIATVDDALGFYEGLKSAENVTVDIKRGGRPRTIEYTIK
ncbi:MAG: type II secretion system protein GspC [Desulfobacterales bacterium]|jgi:general secretion pathway protein C